MALASGILARGPWTEAQVLARWREDRFHPSPDAESAADAAIVALRERGSPSHDGLSARLAGFEALPQRLALELQPARWSLRLTPEPGDALSVLCVTRDADGRWLAGRRAAWLASWAGRWALGAGGAVEVGESPTTALRRELREEWSLEPEQMTVEALVRVPTDLIMLIGLAQVREDAAVVPDSEHDAFAWWPAEIDRWPAEAGRPLRRIARMLERP